MTVKRYFNILLFLIVCASIYACRDLYRAGSGIQSLDYPIDTKLSSGLIRNYIDSMSRRNEYKVPLKWDHFHKLDDLSSDSHKRIYFSQEPEEMYVISFGGMLVLTDVFNPKIVALSWVGDRKLISKSEELRILKRVMSFLDTIEARARRNGVADSLIYAKDPFAHLGKE